jgi:hypothetical protein
MKRLEYLETQQAQRAERRKRVMRRQRFVVANHEPKSKNSMSPAEEIAFQQTIVQQLRQAKRQAFRSKVVLEVDFYSHQNDPPAVHTLAKNYMDLLQKPVPGSGITRKHLVLADDRLIDVLIVNYHLRDGEGPAVEFEVGTMADFVADLALLERIRNCDFADEIRYDPDTVWSRSRYVREEDRLSEALENLRSWERRQTYIEEQWGAAAFAGMHRMNVMRVQELYLEAREPKIEDILTLLAPLVHPDNPMLGAIHQIMRNCIVTPPLMLDLTHAPVPGEIAGTGKSTFKTAVAAALTDFKKDHGLLFPLLATIGVTILCVPPKSQAHDGKETYVDLDNLARYVVPIVHEQLRPPADTIYTFDLTAIRDAERRADYEQQLLRLKRTPKESITQYQMLRMPRLPGDPEKGFVRLALCNGGAYEGLWRRMDKIVFDWEREVD